MYRLFIVILFLTLGSARANEVESAASSYEVCRSLDFTLAYQRVMGNACGKDGKPCLVPFEHGVNYCQGRIAALAVMQKKVPQVMHIINGPCSGECLVFAAWARKFTCLGPEAEVRLFRIADRINYRDPPLGEDMLEFVRSELNVTDTEQIKARLVLPLARSIKDAFIMPKRGTSLFWQSCTPETLVAAAE